MMFSVDISQRLGEFQLDVAFESAAAVTALFGRSGAGKTSVINAIAGITRPERGRIEIGGQVLMDSASRIFAKPESRRIGYVFQDGMLFPHLDVRGNLEYGQRRTPQDAHYVDPAKVLALLGLARLMDRKPAHLSGGERQRVAIGRALLASPKLLLLDEPLASLDSMRKSEILNYIELLRDEFRIPILLVSHAVEEVTRLADQVVLLSEGRVAAQGSPAEVMGRLDLGPLTGRYERGAIIEALVADHDTLYDLSRLVFAGGELLVPHIDALIGERVRVRIRARDVSLALSRPADVSVTNILEAEVAEVSSEPGPVTDVRLTAGGSMLLARVTRQSVDRLGIRPGLRIFALVKAISLDRHSVGFA
ncbi:MAG: molybdenum ABC transporter ATP-binding protein [Betaproteobacteria bacterium]|nr:molybdenum ABC transporter ATP-binding protein [Betaproteobacteria bacterium]